MYPFSSSGLEAACAQKRRYISDKTAHYSPRFAAPLTDQDERILKLSLADIVRECSGSQLKPAAVLDAYGKRALSAHAATNCLSDLMFDEATVAYAPHRALSGVPVSLKDVVDIEGYDTTLGYSAKANKPVSTSAPIVRLLRDAGAIIHVKTTVPTGLLSFETKSDLFGETTNPYNPSFSPGASTGGGAALLAYGGSKVEIATDFGGSVRFPPAFCGLYGMKSSKGRFPSVGSQTSAPGLEGIEVTSPIAKNLDDLREFWERVVGMKPWEYDHTCLPIPWRPVDFVLSGRKPRWGVIWHDGLITPTPACRRALMVAVESLKQQGYDVVDFDPPSIIEGLKIGYPLGFADGGASVASPLQRGESLNDAIKLIISLNRTPKLLKSFITTYMRWFSSPAGRNDAFAEILDTVHPLSIAQERELIVRREAYKASWKQAMKKQEVDFILTVTHALPQIPKNGTGVTTLVSAEYCFIFNLLDYVAGVVPTTFVDKSLDALPEDFTKTSIYQNFNDLERNIYSLYDGDAMHGLPVSVQVAGGYLEEEKVLEGMKLLETALRDSGRPFVQKQF